MTDETPARVPEEDAAALQLAAQLAALPEVPELQRLGRAVVGARAFEEAVKLALGESKGAWLPVAQATGTPTVHVRDDDGVKLGTVSIKGGALKARIADPAAFRAWAEAQGDVAMETVTETRIRPKWQELILSRCVEAGAAIDPTTKRAIPGVVVEAGSVWVEARPNTEAYRRAVEMVRPEQLAIATRPGEGETA